MCCVIGGKGCGGGHSVDRGGARETRSHSEECTQEMLIYLHFQDL